MKHLSVCSKQDVMTYNVPDMLILTWYRLATEGFDYDVQRRGLMMLQDVFGSFEAAKEFVLSKDLCSSRESCPCAA